MIYRPLRERFEHEGYQLGDLDSPQPEDNLFFFNYDWRHSNLESVDQLDRHLAHLTQTRDNLQVDLICQSNAAKICRWLAKYGTLKLDAAESGDLWERDYRVRKLILVGASNNGAMRVLQLLTQGRRYVPVVGRRFLPEIFFSLRPLFEDLPANRKDLFFGKAGEALEIDLFDARNWLKYGWSIFSRRAQERLTRSPREDLFGNRQTQLAYLERQLENSKRFQLLLARDSQHFPEVRYYRLENMSSPTIDRALITQERGQWNTYFLGDAEVDRDPKLKSLAAAPGDGHAVIGSQRGLSLQEEAALVESVTLEGGHFDAIIQSAALDALLRFLADPVPPELHEEPISQ
jgi:hypothetical protein